MNREATSVYFGTRALFIAVALGLGLTGATVRSHAAGDDDYLRAIREEGNKLEYLNRAKEEIKSSEQQEKQTPPSTSAQPVPSYQDIAEFEKALHKDAPASYSLYLELATEKRIAVYNFYQNERKMSAVKLKIVQYYLGI